MGGTEGGREIRAFCQQKYRKFVFPASRVKNDTYWDSPDKYTIPLTDVS